jgi:lysozyme
MTDQEQANVTAFLWMIRYAEGTTGPMGYQTIYGYEYFDDYADHPRRIVHKGGISSSAAGAYQIMPATWDTVIQPALHLPDFSPQSQDQAAVYLLKYRGALDHVKAGRFEDALRKCAKEWASLPGSPYGQPVRTLADVRQAYSEAGGNVA